MILGLGLHNLPAVQETWDGSQGWKDFLEKVMTTYSSILAQSIPTDRGIWQATVHGVVIYKYICFFKRFTNKIRICGALFSRMQFFTQIMHTLGQGDYTLCNIFFDNFGGKLHLKGRKNRYMSEFFTFSTKFSTVFLGRLLYSLYIFE